MLTKLLLRNSGTGTYYVKERGDDICGMHLWVDGFSLRHEILVMSAVIAEITR